MLRHLYLEQLHIGFLDKMIIVIILCIPEEAIDAMAAQVVPITRLYNPIHK